MPPRLAPDLIVSEVHAEITIAALGSPIRLNSKNSDRGLGHTGGTIDKLEAIKRVSFTWDFRNKTINLVNSDKVEKGEPLVTLYAYQENVDEVIAKVCDNIRIAAELKVPKLIHTLIKELKDKTKRQIIICNDLSFILLYNYVIN
ncbi:hypothetical protein NRS6085_21830 [Bacillus subtilis]|jgi:Thymidine phosphorylase|nr:Pyrimidine-nucleoside phosphorylase [Bacillus subtilis]CAI6327927.1 hypothetical protein NRS6085_21830 [Bacillus subtilis]